MAVGDITITKCDHRIIIERKTIEDFYNSIKTRRLYDQLGRIFEAAIQGGAGTIVIIVLEGHLNPTTLASPTLYTTVSAAYTSLMLRDKVSVIRTDSIEDTARFVLGMTTRIDTYFKPPSEFSSLVHVGNNHGRGGRQINGMHLPYMRLLMSIHSISANRAQAIAQIFPTMESLVNGLKAPNGLARLAQLISTSNNRSVGSPIGTAAAINIAEAVLGPSDPIVAECKLLKYLLSLKILNGEAAGIAKVFKSIANLRLTVLQNENTVKIPRILQEHLVQTLTDPSQLLTGLRGVKGVSQQTAENLTNHFHSISGMHAELSKQKSDEGIHMTLRLVGSSLGKRAIPKPTVENILTWLRSDGFLAARLV